MSDVEIGTLVFQSVIVEIDETMMLPKKNKKKTELVAALMD